MTALDRTLSKALTNGRVTAKTANARTIARAVRYRYLVESDLAGVFVLTQLGQCMAGDCPF